MAYPAKRHSFHLKEAAETVLGGGVVAYPTEGVFGLGCDPWNQQAVERILAIKGRAAAKGVILIGANLAQLQPFLTPLSDEQRQLMTRSWPGPNTWVVPHNGTLPDWITGGRDTVAVRVSGHPLARALCEQADTAIVSTSANRSGKRSLTTTLSVQVQLGKEIDFLLPGKVLSPGKASTIRNLLTGEQLR